MVRSCMRVLKVKYIDYLLPNEKGCNYKHRGNGKWKGGFEDNWIMNIEMPFKYLIVVTCNSLV